jgi:predicted O-methyltransferase YrrM
MHSTREHELRPSTEIESARLSLLEHSLVRLWRTTGLNRILNKGVALLPSSVQKRLSKKRARVRQIELVHRVRTRARLVPEEDLQSLLSRGLRRLTQRHGMDSIGAYLEFGVYNGTSLVCMYRELEAMGLHHVRLIGFDSFQGFPPTAAVEDGGRWQPGRCHSTLEFTKSVLHYEGVDPSRVMLVPGWFSDTLNAKTARDLQLDKASAIMIDCDLYSSAKQALEFCAPLIRDEALILFDDWHARSLAGKNMGERRAFAEFLRRHPCFTAVPFGKYANRTETFLVSRRRP